jgi:hypothetical protein
VSPAVDGFRSAGDGWAFTLGQFAAMYAAKMGGNPRALQKVCEVADPQVAAWFPVADCMAFILGKIMTVMPRISVTGLQALWGDYTYSAKTKRITRLRPHKGDRGRPLFVTLALEPLWKAYAAAQPGADHKVCDPHFW